MNKEIRVITSTPEVREANEDGLIPVSGHPAIFNSLSQNLGGFVEVVKPGAFRKTVKEADVRFLLNHDPNFVLARTAASTMTLAEDAVGLFMEAQMAPTTYARDLAINLRLGNVTQMSFGFWTIRDDWDFTDQGMPLRILEEVRVFDTSAVTYPAYEGTDIALRSALRRLRVEEIDAHKRIDFYRDLFRAAREFNVAPHELLSSQPFVRELLGEGSTFVLNGTDVPADEPVREDVVLIEVPVALEAQVRALIAPVPEPADEPVEEQPADTEPPIVETEPVLASEDAVEVDGAAPEVRTDEPTVDETAQPEIDMDFYRRKHAFNARRLA